MIGRVVQESADFINKIVRDAKANYTASIYGMKVEPARHTLCIDYLSFNIPVAIGALYVRKNFDKTTKRQAENLVKELRQSFDAMLEKVDWMDEKTKKAARAKLNAIQQYVAYPDEFFDDEKLDKYFKSLKIDRNSFLKSNLQKNLFDLGHSIDGLEKAVDKNDWISHGISAVVNGYYDSAENSISKFILHPHMDLWNLTYRNDLLHEQFFYSNPRWNPTRRVLQKYKTQLHELRFHWLHHRS